MPSRALSLSSSEKRCDAIRERAARGRSDGRFAASPQTAARSRRGDRHARDRRIAAAAAQIGQRNGGVREHPRGYRKLDNDNDNDNGREVRAIREIA
jgi:hypothetical protein